MEADKQIVLDANILIRAVIGKKVYETLEKYSFSAQFYAPDVCYQDAEKYLPSLFKKRNLPIEEVTYLLEKLISLVEIIDYDLYRLHELAAKQRIAARDVDDWPVIATALLLDCPIWTEDADFFGAGVATWTSDRVHLYLSS